MEEGEEARGDYEEAVFSQPSGSLEQVGGMERRE